MTYQQALRAMHEALAAGNFGMARFWHRQVCRIEREVVTK